MQRRWRWQRRLKVVDTWSIAEEVARRWLVKCNEQERGWVPRNDQESWLSLMREVELVRCAAVFDRSHAFITLAEGGVWATKAVAEKQIDRVVASKAVMRVGRHYAQFTVLHGLLMFGVIRPGWNVQGGENTLLVNCSSWTASARRF
jgi:hypothetical protein